MEDSVKRIAIDLTNGLNLLFRLLAQLEKNIISTENFKSESTELLTAMDKRWIGVPISDSNVKFKLLMIKLNLQKTSFWAARCYKIEEFKTQLERTNELVEIFNKEVF